MKVEILRKGLINRPLTEEKEILVRNIASPFPKPKGIELHVGVDDCLHIKFNYNNIVLHTKDVIEG